jgi:hypothetical protein
MCCAVAQLSLSLSRPQRAKARRMEKAWPFVRLLLPTLVLAFLFGLVDGSLVAYYNFDGTPPLSSVLGPLSLTKDPGSSSLAGLSGICPNVVPGTPLLPAQTIQLESNWFTTSNLQMPPSRGALPL